MSSSKLFSRCLVLWCTFLCVWDCYLPCTVFDLIQSQVLLKEVIIEVLKQVYFSWSLFQFGWGDATCSSFLSQIWNSFEHDGNLNCITLLSRSRSEITCQAGNGKLQHFIGKARAKILCSNLLQSKSASYLSLSEIGCNKFPPDAVSGVIAFTIS